MYEPSLLPLFDEMNKARSTLANLQHKVRVAYEKGQVQTVFSEYDSALVCFGLAGDELKAAIVARGDLAPRSALVLT